MKIFTVIKETEIPGTEYILEKGDQIEIESKQKPVTLIGNRTIPINEAINRARRVRELKQRPINTLHESSETRWKSLYWKSKGPGFSILSD